MSIRRHFAHRVRPDNETLVRHCPPPLPSMSDSSEHVRSVAHSVRFCLSAVLLEENEVEDNTECIAVDVEEENNIHPCYFLRQEGISFACTMCNSCWIGAAFTNGRT